MCVCAREQYCLELYNPKGQKIKACKMEGRGGVVQGKHQSYTLSAASEDERDSWIHAIRSDPPWRCTCSHEQIKNRSPFTEARIHHNRKTFKRVYY